MQEPRQRRQHLSGIHPQSNFFTSVGDGQQQQQQQQQHTSSSTTIPPPPAAPPQRRSPPQFTNSSSSYGSYGSSGTTGGNSNDYTSSYYGNSLYGNNNSGTPTSPIIPSTTTMSANTTPHYHHHPTTTTTSTSTIPTPMNHVRNSSSVGRRGGRHGGGGCSYRTVFLILFLWTMIGLGGMYYYYVMIWSPINHRDRMNYERKLKDDIMVETEQQLLEQTQKITQLKQSENKLLLELHNHKKLNDDSNKKFNTLQKENEQLQQSIQELQQNQNDLLQKNQLLLKQQQQRKDNNNNNNLTKEQQQQINNDWKTIIQNHSKQVILSKWGPGPHKVELEIYIPQDEHPWFILFELAPINDMPHTVHYFLEQISLGLYKDSSFSFHHAGPHMILGDPIPNFRTPTHLWHDSQSGEPMPHVMHDKFMNSGYGKVLFQEYNNNVPHIQYTLGLARTNGRNDHLSGPGWYINMLDNTKQHGPNGYAADGTGDPCFARAITGHEILDRIQKMAGSFDENNNWKTFEHGNVAVVDIKYVR